MKFTISQEGLPDIVIETRFCISGNTADLVWLGKQLTRFKPLENQKSTILIEPTRRQRDRRRRMHPEVPSKTEQRMQQQPGGSP